MDAATVPSGRAADVAATFRGRRAILLDLDGTLYSGAAHEDYFVHTDEVTGLRVRFLTGVSDPAAAFAALDSLREEDPKYRNKSDVLEKKFGLALAEVNRFRERHTEPERYFRPDPRLAALLSGLAPRYRLLLGTNNTPRLARRIVAALGVDPAVFVGFLSSEDAGAAKPYERFFRVAAEKLGVPWSEAVSVGDRPEIDLEPAAALGGAVWRVREPADLFALEALLA
jgi:FMN phosphatase YigB (HAD superfamily)